MPLALTPEAAAKIAALRACLADLGLSADSAHALLLAEQVAEDTRDGEDPEETLSAWQEDGREAWADVLCHVPSFLA